MSEQSTKYDTVEYSVENKIGTLRLNRPSRYNSFTDEMHADLRLLIKEVKKQVSKNELRCLVITGNGKGFCTGQDLTSRYELVKAGDINLGKSLTQNYNPLIKNISELPIPVVCAINGVVAGSGLGLALACDIIIAAESAKFVFAFAKVGLVPDAGCTWGLVQAMGLARAKALSLLGETISAKQAENYGLIWQVVADTDLEKVVNTTVDKLIANPALGSGLTKRALDNAVDSSLEEQLAYEAQLQTIAGRHGDYAEAVCAFVEKRPSVFTQNTKK